MYITYILYSPKIQRFYTGQTKNLDRRLEEHNRGKSLFTAKGIPWMVVFSKAGNLKRDAMKLERFIKKRGAGRFLRDNNINIG